MGFVPPRSMPPPNLPPEVVARTRISALEQELEASGDQKRRAILRYEVGAITERALGDTGLAESHYRAAYDLCPSLSPPLLALQRIYIDQGRRAELERVLQARVDHASRSPVARAAAVTEQALVLAQRPADRPHAESLLAAALELDPDCQSAAIVLEQLCRARGDEATADRVLEARAQQAADPALKGAILQELAATAEAGGDYARALRCLESAAELPHGRFRALEASARVAMLLARPDLVAEATERQADLAARFATEGDRTVEEDNEPQGRFGRAEAARVHAAALFREAAWLRAHACEKPQQALPNYRAASDLSDDPLFAIESCAVARHPADRDHLMQVSERLIAGGISGPDLAALHFRLAQCAREEGMPDKALSAVQAAHSESPQSPVVVAVLEDILEEQGRDIELAHHLWGRSAREPEDAGELALLAIDTLASAKPSDPDLARAWVAKLPADDRAAREAGQLILYRAAMLATAETHDEQWAISDALCDDPVDLRCAAFLQRIRYEWAMTRDDRDAQQRELERALGRPACSDWAPHAARAWAAAKGDHSLLAKAHGVLAKTASDAGHEAAHMCAAARAWLRADDVARGEECLREALKLTPENSYAVAVLEQILLARGETQSAIDLLRDKASSHLDAHGAELALLHAGMAAELNGEHIDAIASYTEAAKRSRDPLSPLWALYRSAQHARNRTQRIAALQGLAEREARRGRGMQATLELAELLLLGETLDHDGRAHELLGRALGHPDTEVLAAVRMLLSPHADGGAGEALHRLSVRCPEDAQTWRTEQIARDLVQASSEATPSELLGASGDDAFSRLWLWLTTPVAAARAWALAGIAAGEDAIAGGSEVLCELRLHALRSDQLAGSQTASSAPETLQARATQLLAQYPSDLAAAIALEETADDAEARASALSARLPFSSPEHAYDIRLARARAWLLSGDVQAALEETRTLCDDADSDTAAWELLRAAAHNEGDYATVVVANDHLAEHASGAVKAALLHESGRCLLEQLGDLPSAELRLRQALDLDPENEEAFCWLHDLLVRKGDAVGLIELLRERLNVPMAAEQRADLLYEAAGIMRALDEPAAVLDTLGELLDLVPEHVAALGMLAETHATGGDYERAVSALRKLSRCSIPDAQRQLVCTGAARFLKEHLHDPAGALAVLEELVKEDLADGDTFLHVAELAQQSGGMERAAQAFIEAAQLTAGSDRTALYKRAGAIYRDHLDDHQRAREAYEQALRATPTDPTTCGLLMDVLPTLEAREKYLTVFEHALQVRLGNEPADPGHLRALSQVGSWRQDPWRVYTAVDALVTLGVASADETRARHALFSQLKLLPEHPLSPDEMQILRKDRATGPAGNLAMLASEAVAAMLAATPHKLGLDPQQRLEGDHALSQELRALLAIFGVELEAVYLGAEDMQGIRLLPLQTRAGIWIVGQEVEAPLPSHLRLQIGIQAFAQHMGIWPLFSQEKGRRRELVMAAAIAAEANIADQEAFQAARAELRPLVRELNRHLPRALRRRLAAALTPLGDAWDAINVYLQAAETSLLRAGLLLTGELAPAMHHLLGAEHDLEAISQSVQALDLLRFWTSPKLLSLHRQGNQA
ncbi:MAG: hypothetical protein OXR73_05135 [Myxococcales bacterium]|nr:hypothetical protein [Myxococcales bacterium]